MKAEILIQCKLFWSVKTKFSLKKTDKLRIIHTYVFLNNPTIKINYLMWRIKFILKTFKQFYMKYLFQIDTANNYWTVSLNLQSAYKTAFSSSLSQICYLQIKQKLTEAF